MHGVDLRHRPWASRRCVSQIRPDPRDGPLDGGRASPSRGSSLLHAVPGAADAPAHAHARASAPSAGRGWIERFGGWLPAGRYHWRWPLVRRRARALRRGRRGAVRPAGRDRADARARDRPARLHPDRARRCHRGRARSSSSSIAGLMSLSDSGSAADPAAPPSPTCLRASTASSRRSRRDPRSARVIGPPAILRLRRYAGAARATRWPESARGPRGDRRRPRAAALAGADAPAASSTAARLAQDAAHGDQPRPRTRTGFHRLDAAIAASLGCGGRSGNPALAGSSSCAIVGQGLLHAKIGAEPGADAGRELRAHRRPSSSSTFLLVFRSGAARLMAMIPSLFAILVMFLVMRLFGIPLNVATILIATDRARHLRERPDPLLLPLPGRPPRRRTGAGAAPHASAWRGARSSSRR